MNPKTEIEVDARKSDGITFFGIRCEARRYCCVALDTRSGNVFGTHACKDHVVPLVLRAYDAVVASRATSALRAPNVVSLAALASPLAPRPSAAVASAS